MKQFIAGKNQEGVRLSRFVQSVTTNLPNSLLYKSFRNKRIKVNGKRAEPDTRLCVGDTIELYINDEFFAAAPAPSAPARPRRQSHPLRVEFEDDQIALLYKPARLLCHSDRTGDANLLDSFVDYLTEKGEYRAEEENGFSPALCNRLDRGTEGLVVGAKTYPALRDMNEIIRMNQVRKEYLTITFGVPPKGRHVAWLQHREKDNKVTIRASEAEGYKKIITDVIVEKAAGPFALCRIGLVTGRTHQIRAHLAFLGTPVLGDIKYGNRKWNEKTGFKTQALCAVTLRFEGVPRESTLHYLNGKRFDLKNPGILEQFQSLDKTKR